MDKITLKQPKVTTSTLRAKLYDGFAHEGILLLGRGTSLTKAMQPMIEYLRKQGVEVK